MALVALPCIAAVAVVAAGGRAPDVGSIVAPEGFTGAALVPQDRLAPDFSRSLLSGSGRSGARALRGHVAVINFWASWCRACGSEADDLRRISAGYRSRGVRFLGVDHRDGRAAALRFTRSHHLGYPSVFDPGGDLLSAYRAAGLPSTFILDRLGRIRYVSIGTIDPSAFRRGLDRILAGRPARASPSGDPVELSILDGRPAANFTLTDQFDRSTALSDFSGKVVVLAFVDSDCEEVCALTAEAMQQALDRLGPTSSRVQLLAINVNPQHAQVSDVRSWSREHQMLHRWRFLTGPVPALRRVWRDYAIEVARSHGELIHDPGLFIIDEQQQERRFLRIGDQRTSVDAEARALAAALRTLQPVG